MTDCSPSMRVAMGLARALACKGHWYDPRGCFNAQAQHQAEGHRFGSVVWPCEFRRGRCDSQSTCVVWVQWLQFGLIPGLCVFGRQDGGGGDEGKKQFYVPEIGLSFLALDSKLHFSPEEFFFGFGCGWVGGWFSLGRWACQITPPPPPPWG